MSMSHIVGFTHFMALINTCLINTESLSAKLTNCAKFFVIIEECLLVEEEEYLYSDNMCTQKSTALLLAEYVSPHPNII